MDYDEEDYRVSGSIPEFGAIFMSNVETKKECLKHNVFALPPSMTEFVKHVKAGMLLFLFEYKKRQLFGVYQASSDGAIDIVPHGFKFSGRHYPAQVRFTQIWNCEPLSEIEFRDAIRENYFSAKKFKFGLSEDQVHRLLYLFSSRKLMNKVSYRPLSEPNIEIACKNRRMLGDARLELGEIESEENDEFSPAAFCDHHSNSFTRANEAEVLADDGVSTEGKMHFYSDEDFLAKRRRLGNADKLITSDVAENEIYDTIGLYQTESPKDALDEVRRSANGRRLSPGERVNKNQVNDILNRSGYLVDSLDVRANDDFTFMQRRRLFDAYKMHNGSAQAFESDQYPVQRDYDTAKHMAYGDDILNLRRQAREWIDDQECLMNRKLESRYHLDRDASPISAYGQPAMQKFRIGAAAGRLLFNESETDFGEGLSSPHPLPYGQRNIHDRKYPNLEQRINKNISDTNFGGYTGLDRRVVDDARLRSSEREDNEDDGLIRTNPVTCVEYPCFSHKQSLSSPTDKLFSEKARSMYNDAISTRVVPYSPEHPGLSHGCFPPITADENSSLVRENNPRFYSRFKDRLPQDLLEPENYSRPTDTAPDFGNKGFPGHQGSLLNESTRSFVNPNFPNISCPINYRDSLISKPSPPQTDLENIGGDNGLLAYPSKSRNNHFVMAPHHGSQHFPLPEIDLVTNKEAKDFSVGISHSERDWASNEGQLLGYPSNMNLKEHNDILESPHAKSNGKRRSVFSRLTSKEESKVGEEKNGTGVNNPGSYMHATADELMELLQQNTNLSQRKHKEPRAGTHAENAVHEKKSQCHIETNHSTMEARRLNDASLDDMPNETRVVDFKRRSDRKVFGGITADHKITCSDEEVKNPPVTTLKRRKLVRPNFSKTGSAICRNETSQIPPAPVLDKDDKQSHETIISCDEAEMPNDTFHPPTECNNNPEEQKNVVAPSISLELKGNDDTTNIDLQLGTSQVLKETTQPRSSEIQIPAEVVIPDLNLPGSNTEGSELSVGCGNNHAVEVKHLKKKIKNVIKRLHKRNTGSSQ